MAEQTNISWTTHTWSPWTGCAKISPACDGCYAAHLMDTRMGRVQWGAPGVGEGTRDLLSDDYWRKPLAWNRAAAKDGARPFVFPSLCDPFDTAVPPAWRWRFVELMEATPHLVWLLLSKRIGNAVKLTDPTRGERPLPRNVALGATFANQEEWDRDWRKLRDAAQTIEPLFTFGSFEPLLGPVDLGNEWRPRWVIDGGETDQGKHKARPTHPAWFRQLRDQCAATGTPYHHKQNGEHLGWSQFTGADIDDDPEQTRFATMEWRGNRWESVGYPMWCDTVDGNIDDEQCVGRVGKRRAGRMLDGRTHDDMPEIPGTVERRQEA